MAGLLPPVIATLIADTKEYMAKMDAAQAKMGEFGAESDVAGTKISNFANKASTAILGLGVAVGVYAVDQAYKFQESLDQIKNQTNLTSAQVDKLGDSIIKISDATGISTSDLAQSAIVIEQAGVSGKNAVTLLNDASEAAVITHTSVADATKAIVAAQTLQIAKGMDVTKLTGILVAGSKEFVGGLSAEEQMLSGRIGAALANYGLSLKTIIPIGAEFAKAGLPTRSITSFANGFANLEKPITDTTGKFTTYYKTLKQAGLNQQSLVEDLRKGNIVGLLGELKDAAGGSATKLTELVNAVFGTSGGASASILIKNLQSLATAQKNLSGAGATSLASAFKTATQQLGPQLAIFEQQLKNSLVPIGKLILPAATDILKWVGDFATDLKNNKTLRDVLGVGAATLFAGALMLKLKNIYNTIFGTVKTAEMVAQGATQITLLQEIATNTAELVARGGLPGGTPTPVPGEEPTVTPSEGIEAAGGATFGASATGETFFSSSTIALEAGEIAASGLAAIPIAFLLKKYIVDPAEKALLEMKTGFSGGIGPSSYPNNSNNTNVKVHSKVTARVKK